MSTQKTLDDFFDFLQGSPTPYHAAANLRSLLKTAGFEHLDESVAWKLKAGGRYVYTRSDSTLVAFTVAKDHCEATEHGLRIIGAHTDSPCLKVKPKPEILKKGYQQLGIEVYGGALLSPWFDRDLSLAGKVVFLDKDDKINSLIIDFKKAIAVIPSLAIHLDRNVNNSRSINAQTDMNPILFQGKEGFSIADLLEKYLKDEYQIALNKVIGWDLSFYDVQVPSVLGLNEDFIAGARFDNLLSSFFSVHALIESNSPYACVAICHDHEEVGSRSETGAQGTVLNDLLERMFAESESRQIALRRSLMLSVDNAHGVHPNFASKHDENHGPRLNEGPVIKFDANQSYATTTQNAALVKKLAQNEPQIPLQEYVTRADERCGSTIGPITAANVGLKTIDIGVPTFAMHSIRELAGKSDVGYLNSLLKRFYLCDDIDIAK